MKKVLSTRMSSWTFSWTGSLTLAQASRCGPPSKQVPHTGLLAAHAVTTIHYLIRRELGTAQSETHDCDYAEGFRCRAGRRASDSRRLGLPLSDFEDAVTAAAAQFAGCDYIVTQGRRRDFEDAGCECSMPEAAHWCCAARNLKAPSSLTVAVRLRSSFLATSVIAARRPGLGAPPRRT